jgi:formate hydrogenlyase subunit 5
VAASDRQGPVDVTGHGVFTLPLGPVRSGVYESIEFLIETPGEDIPHFNIRPHYKHRGIAKRFERLSVGDATLVAERVEGIASVAHALAFAHAVETLADTTPNSNASPITSTWWSGSATPPAWLSAPPGLAGTKRR